MVGSALKTLALVALIGSSMATPTLPRGKNHHLRRMQDQPLARDQSRHVMVRNEAPAPDAEPSKAEGASATAEGANAEASATTSAPACESSACGKVEGGKTEGAPAEGAKPEGGMAEGAPTEGAKPEGGMAEGAKPEGGMAEGAKPEGGMAEGGSSMMEGATSTMAGEAANPMETSKMEGEAPKYGSGSMQQTPLDMCLLSCSKQFGGSKTEGMAMGESPTKTSEGGGSATHTVIVAPTKGVLRYVPFSVDAKPGDTIMYMWGAGPHTVTSSNGLSVCNKSLDMSTMVDSGKQNASFSMPVPVHDTNATFRYCTVAGHCQKGMFGVTNPPAAPGGSTGETSVAMAMNSWANSSTNAGGMVAAVQNNAAMTPEAWAWGSQMDTSTFAAVDMPTVMENILYTRMTLAMNPGMLNGTVDMATFQAPQDVSVLASSYGGGGASSTAQAGAPTGASAAGTAAAASESTGAAKAGAGFRSMAVPAGTGLATLAAIAFLML